MKWHNWVALIVAILALFLSGLAIYIDNVHYQEITKPHTQHDEIYNKLTRLDDRILRAENDISYFQTKGESTEVYQAYLYEAKNLRNQAEIAWDNGKYEEADNIINEAFNTLQSIPFPTPTPLPVEPPFNWWLIGGIITGLVCVAIVVWLTVIRPRTVA
jgi:hypothetical protein